MEIIELTAKNIAQYLDDCITLQKFLVTDSANIKPLFFTQTAQDDHSYFVGMLEEDRIIGMGLVSKVVHPVNITGYVNNIVVHPSARGQGLFSVLMSTLESKAKEWQCTDMALTCSREGVQEMYEKRSYVQKKTHFYTKKF